MTTIFYIFLLAISVFLSGCCPESQLPKEKAVVDQAADNGKCGMIEIENFTVTEQALKLDYKVTNPFGYDIWVCQDKVTKGKYDADVNLETRIDAETVWIRLRFNTKKSGDHMDPAPTSKYRCLPPGESYSGRIFLNLPMRNASPIYLFDDYRKEHELIVLHRAVFEVGYFEGGFVDELCEKIEKARRYIYEMESRELAAHMQPPIGEEIQDGQLCRFLYLQDAGQQIPKEKFAKVVVIDVDIPCSVAVDDK